ncbi:lytic transglycosylase [Pseudohongiella spirulinae]|uniref:Murein transglycosylase n=1 Tax=Pseudohongiella spirulinae TaxID=1249552 RepID=A0A0S2KCR2_9GAMM|nr:LysM peptidoglycan-binding domain-containing protein [Pseudohongiella spirulinae]ALO46106.1 murein transglycosylase [Pseudohongiella spirulinae]
MISVLHKPRFRRRRLAALISFTLLINACSTLQDEIPEEPGSLSEARNQTSTANQTRRRDINRPLPTAEQATPLSEAEIAFRDSIWSRISEGMQFYHRHYNDDIQEAIDWFVENPDYLTEVSERATPFIFEITDEIERRGLPMELALLPVVESAFRPEARSRANAAGLWQFMAPTARSMGLKRDWWYDGRHDPIASTSAALDYLERLYQQFDQDWLLALAAYNAGQGNVSRALSRNQQRGQNSDFWSLALPRETRRHVPRLLGLSYVMADPLKYGLTLSPVPDEPWLARVDVGNQIDLTLAAQLADLEPEVFYQLNPGYLQWATHPDGPHIVNLPIDRQELFESRLEDLGDQQITWDRYQIKPGDTLIAIARNYRTTVGALQQVNNISGSRIRAGDSLLIPRAYREGDLLPSIQLAADNQSPIPAGIYTVRSGDSLWGIANRYRLTVAELINWNQLSSEAILQPGQRLMLQDPALTASTNIRSSQNPDMQVTRYEVRSGDTLVRIARSHGISVDQILQWNNIRRNALIHPGQELRLYLNQ